jgi:hypothetical protein
VSGVEDTQRGETPMWDGPRDGESGLGGVEGESDRELFRGGRRVAEP